jgi:enoyl-CoA hydratase/carnithine racemase
MSVVSLDARLLGSGVSVLSAAITETLGDALLVRVEDAPRTLEPMAAEWLRRLPALTVAVGDHAPTDAFDLVTDDATEADAWCAAFERSPHAAQAAALLVRRPPRGMWTALVNESVVYSLLQAGPDFAAWRDAHPATPVNDDTDRVRVDHLGRVTQIVLTRPERHNALDARLRDELFEALRAASATDGAIVIRGEGPSFCSGGDLAEFGTFPNPVRSNEIRIARPIAWYFHTLRGRTVVGLHGACLGAGIELPAFAEHVVAADDAQCGLPELQLGLIPGAGGTVSITRRAGRARLLELLLLDGTIPVGTALEWGLVDEVVPKGRLEDRVLELSEMLG